MIRITRQTDYGIVLLSHMASRPLDEVHTAKDSARRSGLPLPMVSKILKTLAKERLLVSHRGVKGGYSLAATADQISVGAVISALEGPIGITQCSYNPGGCEREGCCPVQVNWQRISLAVREALDKVSLAELTAVSPRSLDARLSTLHILEARA